MLTRIKRAVHEGYELFFLPDLVFGNPYNSLSHMKRTATSKLRKPSQEDLEHLKKKQKKNGTNSTTDKTNR